MATLPYWRIGTLWNMDGYQNSSISAPQKLSSTSSLAHGTPTISLQTPPQTRLDTHKARFPVETTRSWQGENDNKNVILLPEHHFRTLHLRLFGAEYLFGAFPEAVRERLSRLKRDKYNKQALKGLNTNDTTGLITDTDLLHTRQNYIPADSWLRTDLIANITIQ